MLEIKKTFTSSFIITITDSYDWHSRWWSVTDSYGLLTTAACHTAAVTAAWMLLTTMSLLTGLSRMPNYKKRKIIKYTNKKFKLLYSVVCKALEHSFRITNLLINSESESKVNTKFASYILTFLFDIDHILSSLTNVKPKKQWWLTNNRIYILCIGIKQLFMLSLFAITKCCINLMWFVDRK